MLQWFSALLLVTGLVTSLKPESVGGRILLVPIGVGVVLLLFALIVPFFQAMRQAAKRHQQEMGQAEPSSNGTGSADSPLSSVPSQGERIPFSDKRKPLSSLDREAAEYAMELWKPTRTGESYCVCEIKPTVKMKTVFELRQVVLDVQPQPVTEADKLNGIEWHGAVVLFAKARRYYCSQRGYGVPDNGWSEWASPPIYDPFGLGLRLDLRRTGGKWEITKRGSEILRI